MMVLSLFPSLLDIVAQWIHIYYPPSLLYFLSVVAVLFILLHLTMAVSSLTHRVIILTQTLGLQEQRIKELEALSVQPAQAPSHVQMTEVIR